LNVITYTDIAQKGRECQEGIGSLARPRDRISTEASFPFRNLALGYLAKPK
jgi:hypothetical protein